jgi:hypothetical protein
MTCEGSQEEQERSEDAVEFKDHVKTTCVMTASQGGGTAKHVDPGPGAVSCLERNVYLLVHVCAGQKSRILLANHASMIAKGPDTNALNCETCRLSVPACQRRMAIWVVYNIVDCFMHFICMFIARMLARRLARFARAINTSTSLRKLSIAVNCMQ